MEHMKNGSIILLSSICIITLLLIDFHLAGIFDETREEASNQHSEVCMKLELRGVDQETDVKIVRPD